MFLVLNYKTQRTKEKQFKHRCKRAIFILFAVKKFQEIQECLKYSI